MNTHDTFLTCLDECRLVEVRYLSSSKNTYLTRTCAPLDFGPWAKAKDNTDRYHFMDLDGDGGAHPVCLLPEQITQLTPTSKTFEPAVLISWDLRKYPWHHARDWGRYS